MLLMSKIAQDFTFVYEFLMGKNIEHHTFETISNVVQKRFNKNEYFNVGVLLTMLIRQGDLPGIIQRIAAFYVLHDLFRNDGQNDSPFTIFFVSLLEQKDTAPSRLNVIEKNFLTQLLTNGSKELSKQTPGHILKADLHLISVDLMPIKAHVAEKQKELPTVTKCAVMNVCPAPIIPVGESSIKDLMEGICSSPITPLKNSFAPQFMLVAPPLLPFEDELVWCDLKNKAYHKPAYDSTSDIGTQAKKLIELAFKQVLSLSDQQLLLDELKKDPNLVYQIGLTPNKLPELVENNPLISIEILLKLMNSMQITEYFNTLVNMEITLHSMEVVNRLTTSVDLPTEFVHLYISNCILRCETMKDKYLQSRLVRLVCVFLQSLIRNKIINVKDLFIEVESFCVEFSRIKEAVGLYRLLKHLEFGEDRDPGPEYIKPKTQKLLKSMTRMQLNKVFRKRCVPDNSIQYKFMTTEQVKEQFISILQKAEHLLQMPPVVKIKDDVHKVLSEDVALSQFSDTKYIFTDITYGVKPSNRKVVIRQTDGTLEYAPLNVQKRMNQIYFPLHGRKICTPKMFEEDNLKRCLEEGKYEFIMDRLCIQYEPYEKDYHEISNKVYSHINETRKFDDLRSTRHFGPMAFFLAWHKQIDDLLIDMIKRDYLRNAVELIVLTYDLSNIEYDNKILDKLDTIPESTSPLDELNKSITTSTDDIAEDIKRAIGKSSDDFNADEICLQFIEEFIKNHAIKKVPLELAIETFKAENEEKQKLYEGLRKAHGVS